MNATDRAEMSKMIADAITAAQCRCPSCSRHAHELGASARVAATANRRKELIAMSPADRSDAINRMSGLQVQDLVAGARTADVIAIATGLDSNAGKSILRFCSRAQQALVAGALMSDSEIPALVSVVAPQGDYESGCRIFNNRRQPLYVGPTILKSCTQIFPAATWAEWLELDPGLAKAVADGIVVVADVPLERCREILVDRMARGDVDLPTVEAA